MIRNLKELWFKYAWVESGVRGVLTRAVVPVR